MRTAAFLRNVPVLAELSEELLGRQAAHQALQADPGVIERLVA